MSTPHASTPATHRSTKSHDDRTASEVERDNPAFHHGSSVPRIVWENNGADRGSGLPQGPGRLRDQTALASLKACCSATQPRSSSPIGHGRPTAWRKVLLIRGPRTRCARRLQTQCLRLLPTAEETIACVARNSRLLHGTPHFPLFGHEFPCKRTRSDMARLMHSRKPRLPNRGGGLCATYSDFYVSAR